MPQKIPDVPLMSPTKPLLTDLAEGSGGSSTEESLKKKPLGIWCASSFIIHYYPLYTYTGGRDPTPRSRNEDVDKILAEALNSIVHTTIQRTELAGLSTPWGVCSHCLISPQGFA